MTRLTTGDVIGIGADLDAHDRRLRESTGTTLAGIACHAAGLSAETFASLRKGVRVAVIPLTCGQGVIGGFGRAVAAIAAHLGFDAFVTAASDAGGLAEACERRAHILLSADDERFVAVDFSTGRVADNSVLTARGFVAGLDLMAGGLRGRRVLVIGCGKVGAAAVEALLARGARVGVHDVNENRMQALASRTGAASVPLAAACMGEWTLFLDASNGTEIIRRAHVRGQTRVAAPGVPCGVTAAAARRLGHRLLHDPLQIGVAAMLADVLVGRLENGRRRDRHRDRSEEMP